MHGSHGPYWSQGPPPHGIAGLGGFGQGGHLRFGPEHDITHGLQPAPAHGLISQGGGRLLGRPINRYWKRHMCLDGQQDGNGLVTQQGLPFKKKFKSEDSVHKALAEKNYIPGTLIGDNRAVGHSSLCSRISASALHLAALDSCNTLVGYSKDHRTECSKDHSLECSKDHSSIHSVGSLR